MSAQLFVRRTRIELSAEEVFRWHARPGALERLTPPWAGVRVIERTGGIANGGRVVLSMPVGPLHVRWVAEHRDYVEGRQFRDVQVEGPFARWEHTHRFEPDGPAACYLQDRIEYELPLGPVGGWLGGPMVRSMLDATFAYRHAVTVQDLAAHAAHDGRPLHVGVTGASGLIGSALVALLSTGGHRVTRLVRDRPRPEVENAMLWDPSTGRLEQFRSDLGPLDAVVHLAGESIAAGRWTPARKARIKESRIDGTRRLCESLARLAQPPQTLICASAIGYYGDRRSQTLDEESSPGSGFLAEVCREWEAATAPAHERGIRVVLLRIGVVLTAAGGALAQMLLPFQLGAGGRLGSGQQWMSWVSLDDVIVAMLHALRTESLDGPVNAVAPSPVTNAEFTRTLGRVLSRPTLFTVPAAVARLAFGEMADEALLASTRVTPTRLVSTGYVFRHPDLEGTLRHTLGRFAR